MPQNPNLALSTYLELDFAKFIKVNPKLPRLICEGDSWFSYPLNRNTIDLLDDMGKFVLLRLEKSGDEALDMLSGKSKAYLAYVVKKYKPHALLFSGGGNDIAGSELKPLLNDSTGATTVAECLNEERVAQRLQELGNAYSDLAQICADNFTGCRLFLHGYDYPVISGKGIKFFGIRIAKPWISDPMDDRHVPKKLRTPIMRHVLDRLNDTLAQVAAHHPHVRYIDLRGTLKKDDWTNELHPKGGGFKKIALKFKAALAAEPDLKPFF